MRRKNVIVADSSANLFQADCADFMPVPLKLLAGEKEYVDNEALDVASMLTDLREYKGRSSTACPSVGDWLQALFPEKSIMSAPMPISRSEQIVVCAPTMPKRAVFW